MKVKNVNNFYCLQILSPSEIVDWHDSDKNGVVQTALCPRCRIDSVIGDFDLEFDEQFLEEMQKHWFLQ